MFSRRVSYKTNSTFFWRRKERGKSIWQVGFRSFVLSRSHPENLDFKLGRRVDTTLVSWTSILWIVIMKNKNVLSKSPLPSFHFFLRCGLFLRSLIWRVIVKYVWMQLLIGSFNQKPNLKNLSRVSNLKLCSVFRDLSRCLIGTGLWRFSDAV